VEFDRLDQVVVEARGFRAFAIFGLSIPRKRDKSDVGKLKFGSQSLRYSVSIQTRQPQIEQHHVGRERASYVERRKPVVGHGRRMSLAAEQA